MLEEESGFGAFRSSKLHSPVPTSTINIGIMVTFQLRFQITQHLQTFASSNERSRAIAAGMTYCYEVRSQGHEGERNNGNCITPLWLGEEAEQDGIGSVSVHYKCTSDHNPTDGEMYHCQNIKGNNDEEA
jgi:hypothetical protein